MSEIFNEIFNYIKESKIIDTHEHFPRIESEMEKDTDVLKEYLTHYFNRDIGVSVVPLPFSNEVWFPRAIPCKLYADYLWGIPANRVSCTRESCLGQV